MIANLETIKSHCLVDDNGCWLWKRSITNYGYAQIWCPDANAGQRAHRVTYAIKHGGIPNGLVLDHLCRVKHCINPDHLEAVTQRVNVLRGEGLTSKNAKVTHCKQGHPFDYFPKNGSRQCRTCLIEAARLRRKVLREAKRQALKDKEEK